MSRAVFLRVMSVLLCAAGAFVSYKLLALHVTGSSGSAWFEAVCKPGESGAGPDCAAVLASPHSYFPPKRPDEAPGTPHVPVAFLGLIYFAALGVWLAGVGRPSYRRRWFHLLPLAWILCGLMFSFRFTYVMFTVLDEWCPWCLLTHVLNLVIAVFVIALWPRALRRGQAEFAEDAVDEGVAHAAPRPAVHDSYPSWTRLLTTIGVVVVVLYGAYGQSGLLAVRKSNATLHQCLAAVSRIKGDTAKLVRNWQLAEKHEIPVRADDPVRTSSSADQNHIPVEIVIFSDFKCPSCRRVASILENEIKPLFGGQVRIVFKHYPLDRECNPRVSRTMHTEACAAARMAEAARLEGGNNAFWKVHDLFFDPNREPGGTKPSNVEKIAETLNIDADRLRKAVDSQEVTRRILDDITVARACDVVGTPAIYVSGKRVDPLAVTEIAFWRRLAKLLRKEAQKP
ncbi:MAG: thioredoxin domain-containing protein [Phycisphaerales bacterium]|nr:MAG: thioredoxin domain-containing protein [Phycisphaerales bacterium]